VWFYYACFASIALLQIGGRRTASFRLMAIGVALMLMAGLRAETVDRDYLGYLDYYDDVLYEGFLNVEPTFILLAQIAKSAFDSPMLVFLVYAGLGIALKVVGILQLSRYPLACMLLYFSGFFLLWEMTQMRAAVAGGLLLLCVRPIEEQRWVSFLCLAGLAATFHYAALIFLPLYFLRPGRMSPWLYCSLIPAASVLYLSNFNLVEISSFAPIQLIELKIQSYETYVEPTADRIFNAVFLARCALAHVLLFSRDFLRRRHDCFLTLLKIYFVGLFLHVALASIPGIASRLSELLLVVEVILIPTLISVFKERLAGYVVVMTASITFLAFSLHYTELVRPYAVSSMRAS
jgi:hypothetical protein